MHIGPGQSEASYNIEAISHRLGHGHRARPDMAAAQNGIQKPRSPLFSRSPEEVQKSKHALQKKWIDIDVI